jgi:hypothetical protein
MSEERLVIAIATALMLWIPSVAQAEEPRSTTTVGMPATIEQLVLPGTELEIRPLDTPHAPLVLRIVDAYRHGNGFRYNLSYYALEPGEYDLREALRRKDGSSTADLPTIPVTVRPILPPGQTPPHPLPMEGTPRIGGYRALLIVLGMLWSAGVVFILWVTRRRPGPAQAAAARPVSLADKLRPLVESAVSGKLEPSQRAELERLLIGYWRTRLGLEHVSPAHAMATMRSHQEAGHLLRTLEDWLHRPPGQTANPAEAAALLEPYRNIPADGGASEAAPGRPGVGSSGAGSRPTDSTPLMALTRDGATAAAGPEVSSMAEERR